jgi:hypothetical protein
MSLWRIKEFIARNQGAVVQVFSCLLFFWWFISEPSPEPVTAFLIALVAAYLSFRQSAEAWRSSILGALYEIQFRGEHASTSKVPKYLSGQCFFVKWKVHAHDGEFTTLTADALDDLSIETIRSVVADCGCKLYWVKRNGKTLWECAT